MNASRRLPNGAFLLPAALGADFLREHADGTEVSCTPDGITVEPGIVPLVRTVHLPFQRVERIHLADPDAEAREIDLGYLKQSIAAAREIAPARYVIHPSGLRQWDGRRPGDWNVLVAMLRRLADETRDGRTGPLVIENNRTYWNGIPDTVPVTEADRSSCNRCFGETPAEWAQLQADVDRDDIRLCLDLSHATTSAHLYSDGPARDQCLRDFLAPADRIVHVHWSDNYLHDPRGRRDSHAYPGQGTLPGWFLRAVLALPATHAFEIDADPDAVLLTLEFLRSLQSNAQK